MHVAEHLHVLYLYSATTETLANKSCTTVRIRCIANVHRGDILVVVHISTLCHYQNICWLYCTVCALISMGFNVHGFHRSAIFSKSFVCENLGVNG